MQYLPTLAIMRRALRATVCPACYQRPPKSELLPCNVARSCEPKCAVFVHLEGLKEIAETATGGSVGRYELAVQNQVCPECNLSPSAGDYCPNRLNQSCALSRFSGQAVAVLEALLDSYDPQNKKGVP